MRQWHLRPQEVANLLNPAFCGQVLHSAVVAHCDATERSLPYPLSFLVLPLVLHRNTRETISGQTRHFQNWITDHEEVKVGFADRARQTAPYTREAIIFLLQNAAIEIAEDGGLAVGKPLKRIRRKVPQASENESCVAKAAILGRWFGGAGSPATVFASIGVQP
jgi:hypothetical protein